MNENQKCLRGMGLRAALKVSFLLQSIRSWRRVLLPKIWFTMHTGFCGFYFLSTHAHSDQLLSIIELPDSWIFALSWFSNGLI